MFQAKRERQRHREGARERERNNINNNKEAENKTFSNIMQLQLFLTADILTICQCTCMFSDTPVMADSKDFLFLPGFSEA